MTNKNTEGMTAEEARKYLISEGLDPDKIVKEGLVFIETVKRNIELKKELEAQRLMADKLEQALECYLMAGHKETRRQASVLAKIAINEYQNAKKK